MAAKPALAAVDTSPQTDQALDPAPLPTPPGPHVFVAMAAVQREISKKGIDKTKKEGSGVKFAFRGIDEVMNALAPILSANDLLIVPQLLEREVDARKTQSGSAMYVVTVKAEFSLVSGVDGSTFKGCTFGEAQDMGDKATNKAMSIAYKYFCFQTFCIPLDAADDPDAAPTQETAPQREPERQRSAPARQADDFPGDRQTTSQKAAPRRQAEPDRSAELKAIEEKREALKERSERARIALQRAADDLPTVSAFDRVWNEKCGQIRADLDAAGMKGELAMLADFYAQCRASYGRDESGNSKEGQEREAAI